MATVDPSALHRARIGRYRVLALLGEGAHGLVYAVADPEADTPVALKVLRDGGARSADLKREFRLVADLTHPNLVLPYALETDGDQVFFTMELVRGAPLLEWLGRRAPAERAAAIRSAAAQLCAGLAALHRRGLVHRDIKPSNVLVEDDGRLAILDFGLVRPMGVGNDSAHYFAGSPAGLAPELFSGVVANAATDAYAVGVLLHLALTGRLPFADDVRKSVAARLERTDAPAISAEPADVAELCRGLLEPSPGKRLGIEEALARLTSLDVESAPPSSNDVVFEREAELAQLVGAFERVTRERRGLMVHLPGPSGMGKSALLRSFAATMRPRAWVLEGRAHERDAVPFKALDAAMDQLAHHLGELAPSERADLLPADPGALHFLFPGIARACAIAAPAPQATLADPVARRVQGARALAELLAALAAKRGLVLVLDDLQWGDRDSALLLTELFASPAPPFLVVLSYRAEPSAAPFLAVFANETRTLTVPVGPLSAAGSLRMAAALCRDAERAPAIARESEGCPFIVEMLASVPAGEPLTFEHALGRRVAALSAPARRMLEAIAIAARPVARGQVPFTPDVAPQSRAAWATLVASRLLRSDGTRSADAVEVYHDRIRDAVARTLSDEARRTTHHALGESFAATHDVEGAAMHYAAAGEKSLAFAFARDAAKAAADVLAFDRSAELLALALDCCPPADLVVRRELTGARARALANCGRCFEAARLFLECAGESTSLEALQLRREAMEQFLVGGRIDDGRAVMDALLRDLGVWQPRAAWLTNVALYAEVGRLLLRGPVVEKTRALEPTERLLLDTFGSIGKGFAAYDATLGAWFFLRAARRALDWGDPKLAARGIAYTATLLGFSGAAGDLARAERWLAAGEALANAHGDGHGLAFCQVGRGMIQCCAGEWENAVRIFDAAAAVLDASYAASVWEADTAKNTSLFALNQLGDLPELERRANLLTRDARRRGDLALEVESNLHLSLVALARDDVAGSLEGIERNLGLWTVSGYHFQHWIALRLATLTRLYEGAGDVALALMDRELPLARKANLTSMQLVRIDAADFHGRAALGVAASAEGKARARALARVRADVAALVKEGRPHARAPADMLRGGIAVIEERPKEARAHFAAAALAYDGAAMKTHAATARWWTAHLDGDEAAKKSHAAVLAERGVAVAERWAQMQLGMGTR